MLWRSSLKDDIRVGAARRAPQGAMRRPALRLLPAAIALLTAVAGVAATTVVFGPQTYRRNEGPAGHGHQDVQGHAPRAALHAERDQPRRDERECVAERRPHSRAQRFSFPARPSRRRRPRRPAVRRQRQRPPLRRPRR